jgi:hypothetical protein
MEGEESLEEPEESTKGSAAMSAEQKARVRDSVQTKASRLKKVKKNG